MRKYVRGVTLIELMTVVLVLAILASVAVPSYRRYMIRSNRTEATAALLQVSTAQEKFFLQNNRYAVNAELDDAPPAGLGLATTTQSGYYTISLDNTGSTTRFVGRAVPASGGGQADDSACSSFTINESGVRGSGPDAIQICWK